MSDLTPERLELRRIAEAKVVIARGVWSAWLLIRRLSVCPADAAHRSGRTWYGVEGIKRREDAEYFVAMNRNTVLALLDRIEALQSMLLHLYQDTVVPGTGYCIRCGMIGGHDEWCAMAAVEELLGIEIEGNGEEEGGATDGR